MPPDSWTATRSLAFTAHTIEAEGHSCRLTSSQPKGRIADSKLEIDAWRGSGDQPTHPTTFTEGSDPPSAHPFARYRDTAPSAQGGHGAGGQQEHQLWFRHLDGFLADH